VGGDPARSGCVDLLARVADVKPRLHLFGHVHEDGGLWTRRGTVFANVTTNDGQRGATVIDIDPKTKAIRPVVVPPA
jgi:Icc-related predicted phosphoesterase